MFAYYTNRETYNDANYHWESTTLTPSTTPNFMYNQQVTGTPSGDPLVAGTWSYSPLKYWPNDFADGNVDNQDPAAQGSTTYGGNVSFFAYAPYVAKNALDSPVGITGMSDNNVAGDPTVTYTITNGTVNSNTDLLWGTYYETSNTVLGSGNTGVQGDNNASNDNTDNRTYANSILGSNKTNADLNKQKMTTGQKVGFLFKHALAGLGGGSDVSSGIGFQAVLDVDAIGSGGSREQFDVSGTNDAWRTIVTIKNIEISNDLDGDGSVADADKLPMSGTLNLATGQWTNGTTGLVKQTIGTNATSTYNAELNSKIAELYNNSGSDATWISKYPTVTDYFKTSLTAVNTGDHPGVTETAQNVYNLSTQSPLMFIPGVTPKLRITVEYVVRTYDAALASTKPYTEVTQKISKTITFPKFELNKHYNLIMHLGLTSVKFTASVENWTENTIGDSNNDSTDDNDAYLPINVQ